MKASTLFTLLLLLTLSACGPEPTPFPVEIPQAATATPPPADLPPLRYALLPNTFEAAIPDTEQIISLIPDLPLIQASGVELIPLNDPASDLSDFDVIAGYGEQPGWTKADVRLTVALLLNTGVPPLDRAEVAAVVSASLNPAAISAGLNLPGIEPLATAEAVPLKLRTTLANLGLPDGIAVAAGVVPVPGIGALLGQMDAANITVQAIPVSSAGVRAGLESGRFQAGIIGWSLPGERATWTALVGEANVLDLYTLPVSYQVRDGLTVTFTPGGFPLVGR